MRTTAEVDMTTTKVNNEGPPKEVPKSHKEMTLVEGILSLANGGTDGISRHVMRTWAERNGFNVGSVSPTLVKLVASKRLKRIGKGMYAVTAAARAKK